MRVMQALIDSCCFLEIKYSYDILICQFGRGGLVVDIRLGMAVLLLIATALMMFVALLCFRNRHLPIAKSIVWTMVAASFYAFGYAFEVTSRSLAEVRLALLIEYVGIPFVSTL